MRWLANQLRKPEYCFRPRQLFRRWWRALRPAKPTETVVLPWGLPLEICPNEVMGRQIWLMGVFDIVVTETIWRLLDPGDLVVDVGANIGYVSSLMAAKTGAQGQVLAFEPHPLVFQQLKGNIARWRALAGVANVLPHNQALADFAGTAKLMTASDIAKDSGASSLLADPHLTGEPVLVPVVRLDAVPGANQAVGLAKLDVEGAELQVLKGAQQLLKRHQIRDIVFEDKKWSPWEATRLLESCGYEVFTLRLRLLGPVVRPIGEPTVAARSWVAPSYLATLDPQRALARMRKPGWRCLRGAR